MTFLYKKISLKKNKTKSYLIGTCLSCFLTLISFLSITQTQNISKNVIFIIILSSAILQSIAQVVCFLHIRTNKINWKLISLIFTILIIFILVFGSYWIMSHLHENFT
ncbi:MAG: cytochrome o ubiquinol oxidase subunit IV [Wigglesworthia glossinidia]|nr:cytochrome o ubiquinol oxidase subunit IV [Wigglesworthia glossinidia]